MRSNIFTPRGLRLDRRQADAVIDLDQLRPQLDHTEQSPGQFSFFYQGGRTPMNMRIILIAIATAMLTTSTALAQQPAKPKSLVLIAGKPSHPPGMHEFNAGVQLLARCL